MEIPRRERAPLPPSVAVAGLALAALTAVSIVALDRPVALALWRYEPWAGWDVGVEALEWAVGLPVFSWLSGIVLVLGMVITAAVPRWRWEAPVWMLVAATHIASRYLTLQLKLSTERLRPTEWFVQGGDTFGRDGGVSFPSGHVAIFASIAIPLALTVPRLRPLLAVAAFVMAARVAVDAHWLSDVTGSAALITLIAYALSWVIRPVRASPR